MPKPKAEAWLRESFATGVYERVAAENRRSALPCWLAQHDPRRRPCSGRGEIFHFIPRQRVENALGALLPTFPPAWEGPSFTLEDARELILLAAWDPRNGGIGCEHHHRRFDSHATPELSVPLAALPAHVIEFAHDYDFIGSGWFAERFP